MSSPVANNMQSGASFDVFDLDALSCGPNEVLKDGMMRPDDALEYWTEFKSGLREPARGMIRLALALVLGTSAETDYSERFLEPGNSKSSLQRLANSMADDASMAKRANKMRVFARSLPGFPLLVRQVIISNPWLARERALDYEVDVRHAGVCFDFSEVLMREDIELSPMEVQIIKLGLRTKAGMGRSAVYSGEGSGVVGSAPRDRGVADAIAPDGGRVTGRRGAGPYGN